MSNSEYDSFVMIFTASLYIVGIATILLLPLFIYTVLYKTGERMFSYKCIVLMYLPFFFITTSIISTTVPMIDSSDYILRFHTTLINIDNKNISLAVIYIIFVCDFVITDMLLVLLIDRYITVSKNIIFISKWLPRAVYTFLAITNIFQNALTLIMVIYLFVLSSEVHEQYKFIGKLFLPLTAIYQVSRVSGFVGIIYLNIKFGTKFATKTALTTMRLHKMLVRAVIANVLCTGFFTRLPMFIIFIAFATRDTIFVTTSMNLMLWFQNCAYLGDMLTTLYFVVPFRQFVMTLLCFQKHDSAVHPKFSFNDT